MSEKFNLVKKYYDEGFWTKTQVKNAVGRWITKEEYEQITGETYKK